MRPHEPLVLFALGVELLFAPYSAHPQSSFNPAKLAEMDFAITNAIAEKRLPGAVLWIERNGRVHSNAYGHRALTPKVEPMTLDTIFDAASLTKVLAGAPAVMLLVERGQIDLEAAARRYLPEFKGDGKEAITIRQLLTHTSGLRPGISRSPPWKGAEAAIRLACAEKLQSPPGAVFRYSDINFVLLGEIVQRVSGHKLEDFCAREIYQPLRMVDTGFLPPKEKLQRIAPTEPADGVMLRGTVHDPTARLMGGVAGHAGVFTTASDLARYARMLLNGGELDGARIFKPETVKLMTAVHTPTNLLARRGLGWDIDTGYSRPRGQLFPLGSFGHTGFTGTALWIDPFSKTFWIFLSNRVHPDGKGNILPLQYTLATLAAECIDEFDFANVAGALPARTNYFSGLASSNPPPAATRAAPAAVAPRPLFVPTPAHLQIPGALNGIDVLAKQRFAPLRKLRIGLVTNHTGQDRWRNPTIDLLKNAPEIELKSLFSPEHGIRGELDENVSDSVDALTGLPVYSLYGVRRVPAPEQMDGLDALVFDVQDIGCRFYTYTATMGNCLEAAAKAGLKFFVLDRVNPIGGVAVEGPVYQGEPQFVAWHAVPLRHGMTVGELAKMFNAERGFHADLTVIPCESWNRDAWFDETALPWRNPSPNMRSLTAAALYPGLGLHESAISVGRGTDKPFEQFGAPYIDDVLLASELNKVGLAGVRFVPVRFTPTYSTFKGQECGGVVSILTDRDKLQAVDLGIVIALTLRRLYPNDYALDKIAPLLRHPETLEAIKSGQTLAAIKRSWEADLKSFKKRRETFLLYR
jgi:uncharacterized protein YbbC (DUF1343 family)/CubicO group peptidase (beta-lactamase class C family)